MASPERERTTAPLWVVLLTMVGVLLPFQALSPSSKHADSAKGEKPGEMLSEAAAQPNTSNLVWEHQLLSFLSARPDPPPGPRQACPPGGRDEVLWGAIDKGLSSCSFLIATLPDPIDSRFGYMFDMRIDALQRAVETQGYVMDRFWYPWEAYKKGKEKAGPGHGQRTYREQPGVILFRRSTRPADDAKLQDELLVVFLVGELPNSGVHKNAFQTALDAVFNYSKPDFKVGTGYIRILGPSFSGSQLSLERAIDEWPHRPECAANFLVYSGSASGIQRDAFQNRGSAKVTFHSAIHRETDVMKAMMRYLRETQGPGKELRVALLCESNTGYGLSVIRPDAENSWFEPGITITTLPFPQSIAQVRKDLTQGSDKKDTAELQLPSLASGARIPFDDNPDARDVEPSLSPEMSAVAAELMLSHILGTIAKEEIRYVGLVATDTRDKLFLANMIRQFCPDVQLFTTASDLLLTRPEYTQVLRGTIVGSSYPLFPRNQRWTFPYWGNQQRFLFSEQGEEGTFNAALALVGDGPTCPAFRKKSVFLDFGMPFIGKTTPVPERIGPQIWINMVGRRGLWPLKVVPAPEDHDYVLRAETTPWLAHLSELDNPVWPPQDAEVEYPYMAKSSGLWICWVLGIGLVCGCLGYQAFRVTFMPPPSPPHGWWKRLSSRFAHAWELFHPTDDETRSLERERFQKKLRHLFAFCFVCLILAFFVRQVTKWSPNDYVPATWTTFVVAWLVTLGTAALCALGIGMAVADLTARQAGQRTRPVVAPLLSLLYYLTALVIAASLRIWWRHYQSPADDIEDVHYRFWFERCTNLASASHPCCRHSSWAPGCAAGSGSSSGAGAS
jgi:hypothetical protein